MQGIRPAKSHENAHNSEGRKNRWGCSSNSDCIQACRRTCSNFLRPLCYSSQCYCQAVGYLRNEYQRMNLNINEPVEMYDYDLKHI
ncbi:jg26286 [Pararge aegeria aegeria]|uniref:Jg26286 protein n=1 Tax=Pararge aegeria aegeria TaxID=348720 RepID=A0A8S4QM11_9NEOP|nr:jg26286 [Pararge aegeria aegeria]